MKMYPNVFVCGGYYEMRHNIILYINFIHYIRDQKIYTRFLNLLKCKLQNLAANLFKYTHITHVHKLLQDGTNKMPWKF